MSMSTLQLEGFVLHSIKFRDYDQIATIFTQSHGLIKGVFKGAFRSKNNQGALTATLSEIQFACRQGRSELGNCYEISPLNFHLKLRGRIDVLEAAFEMVQALLFSQPFGKATPELYQLFKRYLESLPSCPQPALLAASFQLKILRYEGLFNIQPLCAHCQNPLQRYYLDQGDSFCREHAPPYALALSQPEVICLNKLAFCLSFAELFQLRIEPEVHKQIQKLFNANFRY